MGLLAQIGETVRRHAMLAGGEIVLVGVSGGPDSVALLHGLCGLAPALRLRLHVLHVDHGLRPDSARDAEFVAGLGERLGVPVHVASVRVERRGSLEATARTARYAALEAWADRVAAHRIAVGHTADDQAETILMRLLTGAGVRGLGGIRPVRGRIIRPLIEVRRSQVLAELGRAGLPWLDDPSNRDTRFLRNRIRHHLLPELAASYNPAVVTSLARLGGAARSVTDAIARLAADELARLAVVEPHGVALPLAGLRELPEELGAEVLRQAAARLGLGEPLRSWGARALRRALAAPPPRGRQRVGGLVVEVSAGRVRVARSGERPLVTRVVPVPGRLPLPESGHVLAVRLVQAAGYEISRDPDRAAFDADRLPTPLAVRTRRRGDRVPVLGGGARRLKTLLIDARVPRWARDRVPIVEAAGEIAWVAGVRRGAVAPIGPATCRIVELHLEPLTSASLPDESRRSS